MCCIGSLKFGIDPSHCEILKGWGGIHAVFLGWNGSRGEKKTNGNELEPAQKPVSAYQICLSLMVLARYTVCFYTGALW